MLILLVRHAAATRPAGVADHDRPLSDRGVDEALSMGRQLARVTAVPDRIVSSTARRAVDTARLIAEGWGDPADLVTADNLYHGGVDDIIAAASRLPRDVVAVVGHEPATSATVARLCGARMAMVTGAAACIEVPDGRAPREGDGVLRWMLTPGLLRGPAA
jgi:phosphohistidine phosphatase